MKKDNEKPNDFAKDMFDFLQDIIAMGEIDDEEDIDDDDEEE